MDKDKKVLSIGNPTFNHQIWELYQTQINNNKVTSAKTITQIELEDNSVDLGNIEMGKSNYGFFHIKNTGENPLIISHISTSCGCTSVEYDKKPVDPGKETEIKVEMNPDETGYFNKMIEVHCNIEDSPIKLTISGNTIK